MAGGGHPTLGAVGSASRATILATAALAMHQVDLVIRAVGHTADGRPAPEVLPTLNTTLELDADGYSIVARHWSRHPSCQDENVCCQLVVGD